MFDPFRETQHHVFKWLTNKIWSTMRSLYIIAIRTIAHFRNKEASENVKKIYMKLNCYYRTWSFKNNLVEQCGKWITVKMAINKLQETHKAVIRNDWGRLNVARVLFEFRLKSFFFVTNYVCNILKKINKENSVKFLEIEIIVFIHRNSDNIAAHVSFRLYIKFIYLNFRSASLSVVSWWPIQ